ncbi:MAG: Spy/CpxP family protein refolding chaperone [Candidatus Eisenbacteria bacterium]
MNRKLAGIAVFVVAAILLWSATAPAAGGGKIGRGRDGGGYRIERLAARLDLTDEQKEKMEGIHERGRAEMDKLRKEMMRAKHDLRGEFLEDEPNAGNLKALTKKIGDLRTQMDLMRLDQRLAIRDLLTPEQRDEMFFSGGPGHGPRGRCRAVDGRDRGHGSWGPGDRDGDGPGRGPGGGRAEGFRKGR